MNDPDCDCTYCTLEIRPSIIPTCDICRKQDDYEGDDWNGETGNHISCEEE